MDAEYYEDDSFNEKPTEEKKDQQDEYEDGFEEETDVQVIDDSQKDSKSPKKIEEKQKSPEKVEKKDDQPKEESVSQSSKEPTKPEMEKQTEEVTQEKTKSEEKTKRSTSLVLQKETKTQEEGRRRSSSASSRDNKIQTTKIQKTEEKTTEEKPKQCDEKQSKLFTPNPLLENLNNIVVEMQKLEDKSLGKKNNSTLASRFVTTVSLVLNHQTKNMYYVKERNIVDIFYRLKSPLEPEKVYKEFESYGFVNTVSTSMKNTMFVQFLLERNLMLDFVRALCESEDYIKECYNTTSVMFIPEQRQFMLCVLQKISGFTFSFGFPKASTIVELVKDNVKRVTDLFSKVEPEKQATVGDEKQNKEIGEVVHELANSLLLLYYNNLKKVLLTFSTNIWSVLEKSFKPNLQVPKELTQAISTVNEEFKNFYCTPENKFIAFICQCLNCNIFGMFLKDTIGNSKWISSHYTVDAVLQNPEAQKSILALEDAFSKFKFSLILNHNKK